MGELFDSKTSRPLSFWFSTARGWNFFALTICSSNQFLTSSCSSSTRFWWLSSRCLAELDAVRQGVWHGKAVPIQLEERHLPLSVHCIGCGQVLSAYHLLIAYWTSQTVTSTGSSILTRSQQNLAAYIFPRLGGGGGAVGRLAAQRQGALRGRQQARIADMAVLRLRCLQCLRLRGRRRHGGRQVPPAPKHATAAQGPAGGHGGRRRVPGYDV